MFPVSAAFLDAVANGGEVMTVVDVLENGAPIAQDVPVVDGTVRMRARSKVRRTVDVTIAGDEWVPRSARSALTPAGQEVVVRRGFVIGGVPELVPLGIFPIVTSETSGDVVRVTGPDRSYMIAQQYLPRSFVVSWRAGVSFVAAWLQLIGYAPWVYVGPPRSYRVELPDFDLPTSVTGAGVNRWEEALTWADNAGAEVLFDGLGTLILRPPRTFSSDPDYVIRDGEGGTLTEIDLKLDRTGVFNLIRLRATHPLYDAAEVTIYDNDPSSPTYLYGPYGRVERVEDVDMIPVRAQMQRVARAILERQLGAVGSLDLEAVPNPALEEGDLVLVQRDGLVDELHVIEDITLGLGAAGKMKCTTRARTAPGWDA